MASDSESEGTSNCHASADLLGIPENKHLKILLDTTIPDSFKDRYVVGSLFTGGHDFKTRAYLKDKVIDSEMGHNHIAGPEGSLCWVPGCDAKVMSDDQGRDCVPCQCDFKICSDCFRDAMVTGDRLCLGCKEPYEVHHEAVVAHYDLQEEDHVVGNPKLERRLSLIDSTEPKSMKNQTFDLTLFKIKGNYGYGNAMRTKNDSDDEAGVDFELLKSIQSRPITRKLNISATILSSYRLLVIVRTCFLALFLAWRIINPNEDAIWLWGMSVVCEIWFTFSWLLDQLPKLFPINRSVNLDALKEKFETPNPSNPEGKSDLPGIDAFVSTADTEKEPALITSNTILSILAADYPVEKLSCYVSDDRGSLLVFEAVAEAANFANLWVPFCRKHYVEPRNPETYFNQKRDPYKNKVHPDFVRDRRRVKREYDEYKIRINNLCDSIQRCSSAYNVQENMKVVRQWRDIIGDESVRTLNIPKATWMADGSHWPGTWIVPAPRHSKGDHASVIRVILKPASDDEPIKGGDSNSIDLTDVEINLPMLVYISREKQPSHDHNKKAGAMNALLRASAIMSNAPFIINLDCDHYVYNSQAFKEGISFMMDRGGDRICYVQFPQRFEGIDPSDRYANPIPFSLMTGCCSCCFFGHLKNTATKVAPEEDQLLHIPKKFGNSSTLIDSIQLAAFQGRPLAYHPSVKNGRPAGALITPRELLDGSTVAEAISVISCSYEDKTEWGQRIGWIYGSITEDVITGYRMHNRGWKSVYHMTKRDAFRGTAPINLTDRLHQVLRWATGSVEILFSRNNALFASPRMKLLQRIAYLNIEIYPFTSIFLIVYCLLPALCLLSDKFVVQSFSITSLIYLLVITLTTYLLTILEIKWSGIDMERWWRNEQFWLIGGTSSHFAAVLLGLLKVIAGINISFNLTSKPTGDNAAVNKFTDLYIIKWTSLMILPITIILTNLVGIATAVFRTMYNPIQHWSHLIGGVFFSCLILAHFYPFAKGLMGRQGKTPTIVCLVRYHCIHCFFTLVSNQTFIRE
ncbi:hypothetical protein EZV62_016391 [Acer yangbiense]|uniref:Cellulose synthase-like protein D3 n=1 Tax=Acer yangbiense TaxID=1000413 RepID=A0A5C7HQR2_9ROSI|nr:hypothetical protein EZV62_016391 [Acer yangbiense]